jgi:outer membrane protein TolC
LKLVEADYKAGLSTHSDFLLADGQLHQAEISEIEARAERYQDTVALFASLDGGWWNAPNGAEAARQ